MSVNDEQDYANYRRNRVKRLKKIIKITILLAILIPLSSTVVLSILYANTRSRMEDLQTRYDELLETMEQLKDDIEYVPEEREVYSVSPIKDSDRESVTEEEPVDESENNEEVKQVYFTFDDGPSSNTNEILDILDEYGIKATFFVVGKTDDVSVAAYKRIVDDGHTLGMHSYSHKYSQIYASKEAFAEDLTSLQEYLYEQTGVWSRYYRFPGGSSNTAARVDMGILIDYLDELDITYFDWNIVSGDAVSYSLSSDTIYQNCVSKLDKFTQSIILMHDAQARHSTVEALPRIIEYIQSLDGYEICAINDDTKPVQHRTKED